MTKVRIALYVALIFIAGGVAGAGLRSVWKPSQVQRSPMPNRDAFAKHIFDRMQERLQLTPEQIVTIEPVFRKGWEEVRVIQDRSVKEVRAALQRNHEELAKLLTPEQRQKLEEWDQEREKAFRERRGRRHNSNKPEHEQKEKGNRDPQEENDPGLRKQSPAPSP